MFNGTIAYRNNIFVYIEKQSRLMNHLKTGQRFTIQNRDVSEFQIPTIYVMIV